jgi:predicted amidophosphoribosyltransferase
MPISNCVRCKKLFNRVQYPVCPACEPDEEADFAKVRQALIERPNQSAEEVAEETGVDLDCVLRLVDAGRIANVRLGEGVTCGRCGAPAISFSKRLCEACLKKLNMELAAEQSKIVLPPKRPFDPEHRKTVREAVDEKRF